MEPHHPITPPPELVGQWLTEAADLQLLTPSNLSHLATQAAQWGSDQELEACCEALDNLNDGYWSSQLRAARRPKPPSLKEQAIKDLDDLEVNLKDFGMGFVPITNLRKALEALPND